QPRRKVAQTMLKSEFEKLTGFYPTQELYAAIEADYAAFDGDKNEYCKAYKANADGLAEKIQRTVDMKAIEREREIAEHIKALESGIADFKKALEREAEWKPYESKYNAKQADYAKLANGIADRSAHYMTDAEAVEWICTECGFDRSRITILHEIDKMEINRHNVCRKTGEKIDRRPIYCATDCNYVLFNIAYRNYEIWDGELELFYC
ncbi:MAG: hypothetical protein RSG96_04565, partial [Clostridia bacterium]